MKKERKSSIPKVNRIFTNREQQLEIFWNQYKTCQESMKTGDPDISVLMYYGIGGIGKSALIEKIISEMKEKLSNPQYVYYDFNVKQDKRSVLKSLRNHLVNDYKFSFPLFDLALYNYAQKNGEDIASSEIQHFINSSVFLTTALHLTGTIQAVKVLTTLTECADTGIPIVEYLLNERRTELVQIERKWHAELYEYLPYLFAQDLTDNLAHNRQPLVIFLDTYEKLVNEMLSIGEPLNNDAWIRGDNGLIPNIPNVLWVIAGREKLKREVIDSGWSEALEQHLLGSLTQNDSAQLLRLAGITDPTLLEGLYQLTKGTPVYLDLCVDLYEHLIERGEKPELEMFGQNERALIEHFVRCMDDSKKDIVYILSLLEIWDDAMVYAIGENVLPDFSWTAYEAVKDYSFVAEHEDLYIMDRTIREVLADNRPMIIVDRTIENAIQLCGEMLANEDLSEEMRERYLLWYVRFKIQAVSQGGVITFFDDEIQNYFDQLIDKGKIEIAEKLLDIILPHIEEQSEAYAYLILRMAYAKRTAGDYALALKLAEKSKNIYAGLRGTEDVEYLNALKHYGVALFDTGNFERSFKIFDYIVSKREEIQGKNHPDTIDALYFLSANLRRLDHYEEALLVSEDELSRRSAIAGDNDPHTISAMENVALILFSLGKNEEALKIQEEVLSKRMAVLGANHPETLDTVEVIANILSALRCHKEALIIRSEVLCTRKEIWGENHPDTVTVMQNMAKSLFSLGEFKKVREIQEEILSKRREIYGDKHLDTISAMRGMVTILSTLGEYEEALKIQQEVLSKRREIFGDKHTDTINAMRGMVDILSSLGEYEEAVIIQEEVLSKSKEVLGENHPDTISAMRRLGFSLYSSGKCAEAKVIFEEALSRSRETFGEDHLDTKSAKRLVELITILGS